METRIAAIRKQIEQAGLSPRLQQIALDQVGANCLGVEFVGGVPVLTFPDAEVTFRHVPGIGVQQARALDALGERPTEQQAEAA